MSFKFDNAGKDGVFNLFKNLISILFSKIFLIKLAILRIFIFFPLAILNIANLSCFLLIKYLKIFTQSFTYKNCLSLIEPLKYFFINQHILNILYTICLLRPGP